MLTFFAPWAFISYYPALVILGKAKTTADYVLGLCSPAVGAGVLAVSIFAFHCGMKRYSSTGN